MLRRKVPLFFIVVLTSVPPAWPQSYLMHLHATKDSPLYTTYAAALQRSEFAPDVGYHFVFYDTSQGVEFRNQKGGDWSIAFCEPAKRRGQEFVSKLTDLFREPVITTSYSDIVKYDYSPFKGIRLDATFLVYSSQMAVQELVLRNLGRKPRQIIVAPFLKIDDAMFHSVSTKDQSHIVTFRYLDQPDGWMIDHNIPHVDTVMNFFMTSFLADSAGFYSSSFPWKGEKAMGDTARSIAFFKEIMLRPNASVTLRIVRLVGRASTDPDSMMSEAMKGMALNLNSFVTADGKLYRKIPRIHFSNPDEEMMYWSAFTLLRQCMLPPEGKANYNYYVFSREPVWGWGHGGQVFHESLSMLAYVFMDPKGAMNSQRVFMERQHSDGYIDYRVGPYLDEIIPYNGLTTTSAPWFSWENWEIYKVTEDKKFLKEAYELGKQFFDFWKKNRDSEHDGLFEWGGHAVLESVRDDQVAIWDQVGWPSNFEGPDLNSMLVMESRSLSKMARELGKKRDVREWNDEAARLSSLINKNMWDDSTGFYYNVNKNNHSFTFRKAGDLKRQEIIGFLPLWAGVADKKQAATLVRIMMDTSKFWRRYGVPSLAADDPYYNPRGYWNGPVWVEWEYLLERGLLQYGYRHVAQGLVNHVVSHVIAQLKKDHYFWEFYDPDQQWAGYHRTYIWAGLVSRMLLDLRK